MKKFIKTIRFYNDEKDDFGMPNDYRVYLVIGREPKLGEAQQGEGIAKAYPISGNAASLNPDNVVASGGPEGAVDEAIKRLKELNKDLTLREEIQTEP